MNFSDELRKFDIFGNNKATAVEQDKDVLKTENLRQEFEIIYIKKREE